MFKEENSTEFHTRENWTKVEKILEVNLRMSWMGLKLRMWIKLRIRVKLRMVLNERMGLKVIMRLKMRIGLKLQRMVSKLIKELKLRIN